MVLTNKCWLFIITSLFLYSWGSYKLINNVTPNIFPGINVACSVGPTPTLIFLFLTPSLLPYWILVVSLFSVHWVLTSHPRKLPKIVALSDSHQGMITFNDLISLNIVSLFSSSLIININHVKWLIMNFFI